VPEKYIYGKAMFRYWPFSQASTIRRETDYGLSRTRFGQPTPTPEDEEVAP
jgi:hypothetical protein